MMISIKEIKIFDYLFNLRLVLPPLGVYSVKRSSINEGVLLGAYYGDKPVGLAVLEFAKKPVMTYIFVDECFRRQGIGERLVDASLEQAKSKGFTVLEAYVVLQNEYGEIFDCLLREKGFQLSDTAAIVRYARDEKCSREWAVFKSERGSRICNELGERGYKTLPFSEASPELLEKLRAGIGKGFPSNLDPFNYIVNKVDRIVPGYSFITHKNGDPAAFVTVTSVDDKTLVFQQLSSAFKYQGSGVFLLPFAAFMEKFLSGDCYSKMSAMVYDNNFRMKRLIQSFFHQFAESIKTQNMYIRKLL